MPVGLLRTVFLTLLLGPSAWGQPGSKGPPKAKVDLVSSVNSIEGGRSFDVGLRFRMDKGWHIYWQNPGDAGKAPVVKWTLPQGFTAGELQFPIPTRHVSPGNIITHILEEEAMLPVTITASAELAEGRVPLTAEVDYLICKESCLLESAKVKLELPVAKTGVAAQPDNVKVFEAARSALPSRSSKHVTVSPVDPPQSFATEGKFVLSLALDVVKGFHIQSHTPLSENFVKSDILMERTPGFSLESPQFPPGQLRPMKVLGQISEYSGRVVVKVPGQAPKELPAGPVRFGGLLTYQACNEQGNCFPPDTLAFSFSAGGEPRAEASGGGVLPVETQPAVAVNPTSVSAPTGSEGVAGGLAIGVPKVLTGAATGAAFEVEVADEGSDGGAATGIFGWLLFAFVGGLILNVMPCVLPVISIKVLSLVQQADEDPARIFRLGMTFVAGIVVSFFALAVVIIVLKSTGEKLGWGFQFQSPTFIVVMTSLIFLFGLSLFGVFEITLPGSAVQHLATAESREGYTGAFMKGLLGTVLATPCTAPYLGGALGWAFTSATNFELLTVFASVGLGMASPFMVLAMRPGWLRYLPRPGQWMEHFKQFMGFLLMGTVIWLLYPLGHLIGPEGLIFTLVFLTFLGVGAWLLGKQTALTRLGGRWGAWAVAVGVAAFGWWTAFGRSQSSLTELAQAYQSRIEGASGFSFPSQDQWKDRIPWQPWAKGRPEQLASLGYTVYVDYTATWCATCIVNKQVTLETDTVRAKMADLCVVPLKADFTSKNPEILEELERYGRAGVPTNVIFPAGKPSKPILLPEQLVGETKKVVRNLEKAGASIRCGALASAP